MIENITDTVRPIVKLIVLLTIGTGGLFAIGYMLHIAWYEVYGNWLYKYIDPIIDRIRGLLRK